MFTDEQTLEPSEIAGGVVNPPDLENDFPNDTDTQDIFTGGKTAFDSSEEDEKETYSRNVRKRIDKLTYQKNIALERTARLEQENKEIKHRLEELAKAQQADFESRNKYSQDQHRQELLARKKEALELADYDLVTQIDDELFDIRIKQQTQQPRQQQAPVDTQPATQQAYIPEAMRAWEANNAWIYDQKNPRAQAAKKLFEHMVQNEGFDYEDADTFSELDKRLMRQAPPPSGAPDRGRVVGNDRSVTFTSEDRSRMRDFNLDPDNPSHRAEWLKNKSK